MPKLTHKKLVKLAAKWLAAKNPIVLTEIATEGEEPDALGFKRGGTTLIECKASRADFLADKKKPYRRDSSRGVGDRRYFMAPKGMLKPDEIPLGWGLIEVDDKKRMRVNSQAKDMRVPKNHRHEQHILMSLVRRLGAGAPQGVSISTYTYDTKGRTTLGVLDETAEGDTDA